MQRTLEFLKPAIRWLAWLLFATLHRALGKARYQWMAHYLSRKGGVMDAAQHCNGLTLEDLAWAWECNDSLVESTTYRERGFYGRPELFYLVGGFNFTVDFAGETVNVVASDIYDWHHHINSYEEPMWYASPIPRIPVSWVWPLNDFLGHTFFQESFGGDFGVSNYLWWWLDGKPFTTIVEWEFPAAEWDTEVARW